MRWIIGSISLYSAQEENPYTENNHSVTAYMGRECFWGFAAMLTVRNASLVVMLSPHQFVYSLFLCGFQLLMTWRICACAKHTFVLVLCSVFSTYFASWITPDWCESDINQGSHLDPPDPNDSKESRSSVSLGITSEVRTLVEVNYLYFSSYLKNGRRLFICLQEPRRIPAAFYSRI